MIPGFRRCREYDRTRFSNCGSKFGPSYHPDIGFQLDMSAAVSVDTEPDSQRPPARTRTLRTTGRRRVCRCSIARLDAGRHGRAGRRCPGLCVWSTLWRCRD